MDRGDTSDGEVLDVRVPGRGRYLAILRSVAGRAAGVAGFSFDGIEDLALAVDEAAVLLLDAEPSHLEMAVTLSTGSVSVILVATGAQASWPPAGLEDDTRWLVLGAMCEKMWILEDVTGIGLSQTTR